MITFIKRFFRKRQSRIMERLSKRKAPDIPVSPSDWPHMIPMPPQGLSRATYGAECGDRWLAQYIRRGDYDKRYR